MRVGQDQPEEVGVEGEAFEVVGGEEPAATRVDGGDDAGESAADENRCGDHGEGVGGAGLRGDGVVIVVGADAGADAGRGDHADDALGDGDGKLLEHVGRFAGVERAFHVLAVFGEEPEGGLFGAAIYGGAGEEAASEVGDDALLAGGAGGHAGDGGGRSVGHGRIVTPRRNGANRAEDELIG